MTITLLLDLDDTLLNNDIRRFMPVYLKGLSSQLARHVSPEKTIRELLAATEAMIRNDRPDLTLEEKFDEKFYPALGLPKAILQPAIDSFYANIFPTIRTVTSPYPQAARLVNYAIQKGHRLAIATNPLFPLTAITQRLTWAGFPTQDFPFVIIPSYETFHFAKPDPAFFSELLGQIGWPNDPVIMVGNDPELDLKPAAQIGLSTFWVTENPSNSGKNGFTPTAAGTLDDLIAWIDQEPNLTGQNEISTPHALLATLRATPAVLLTSARKICSDQMTLRPAPTEWSFTEIVCHLRDLDKEVNLTRIRKVLAEENTFLPGVVSDPWADERKYNLQDCCKALQDFTAARIELISVLQSLIDDSWNRVARHAIFGPTSLKELVEFIATHDRNHLQQVTKGLEQKLT